MNKLDKDYTDLLQDILDNGTPKSDRTGTGTISVFGRQIRHKMSDGFPLLTTKKIPFKTIVTELLWFLRGETNIKYLVDNNCHIWDGDAYKRYCNEWAKYPSEGVFSSNEYSSPTEYEAVRFTQEEFINKIKTDDEFAKKWGELGKIYGFQWRNWEGYKHGMVLGAGLSKEQPIDQIQNLINDLKTNPDSRRLMVNAWAVHDLPNMVLPPCHYGFQVYTRELSLDDRKDIWNKNNFSQDMSWHNMEEHDIMDLLNEDNIPTRAISLMWNQRSVDTFLGLPFNIASYGLLLEIIAKEVNMVPDELIGNLGDTHLYLNHLEQAKEQIGRELSYQERYDYWFATNYETGMEKNYDNVPDFDDEYYDYTPTRTREPLPLPKLKIKYFTDSQIIKPKLLPEQGDEEFYESSDFILEGYKSHSKIDAPLSN